MTMPKWTADAMMNHLALLGWVPAFNILTYYLFNVHTHATMYRDYGTVRCAENAAYPEKVISWEELAATDAELVAYAFKHCTGVTP